MDAQGRTVKVFDVQDLLFGSDLSALANGAYTVRIGGQVRRVVLEH